jgi:murein DD-endopeptidase MepM/ murein hydrolase activator NlpD
MMRHLRESIFSVIMLVTGAAALPAQLNLVGFDIRVPSPPTAVRAAGATVFVYELRIINLGTKERAISGLDIRSPEGTAPLLSWGAAEIKAASRLGGAPPGADGSVLPAGRSTLVYVWASVPDGTPVPRQLQHRLIVSPPDSVTAARRDTLDGYVVTARTATPRVISPPFAGGPWLAANGPSNTSGHRRTAIPLAGEARIAQRFATDWIKIGPDGGVFHGDSTKNANWYGYGTSVIAVADGIVTEVKDGIIENVPMSPTMAVPITLETVGGNHVILDLGDGVYAFYAHLQPGSLKVKLGDKVKRGQILGLLGNSGNSTAPHLHFHLTDGSSPLGAEGIPFVFETFEQLDVLKGDLESQGVAWKQPAGAPRKAVREIPLENSIVRWP